MAEAARRMPALRSSAFSAAPGGLGGHHDLGQLQGEARRRRRTRCRPAPRDQPRPPPSFSRMPPGTAGHHHGDAAQQAELGVGLDQLLVAAHGGGHDRARGDRVGLLQHQHQEGLGVEEQVRRGAARSSTHSSARSASEPTIIQRRPPLSRSMAGPDERRRDRERGDREHQVERRPSTGPASKSSREEHRAGQADGEQGVAGHRRTRGCGPGA